MFTVRETEVKLGRDLWVTDSLRRIKVSPALQASFLDALHLPYQVAMFCGSAGQGHVGHPANLKDWFTPTHPHAACLIQAYEACEKLLAEVDYGSRDGNVHIKLDFYRASGSVLVVAFQFMPDQGTATWNVWDKDVSIPLEVNV